MGILDSILGSIAGNALGRPGSGGLQGFTRGGGQNRILMALLPVVLGMIMNRRGIAGRGQAMAGSPMGGGLGGLGALAGLGGLGALLQRFQEQGYGQHVQSWISTGENEQISPDAVSQVLGGGELSHIAAQAGVTEDEARVGLSQLLPHVVDQLTPQGQLPDEHQLASTFDRLERELEQQGR